MNPLALNNKPLLTKYLIYLFFIVCVFLLYGETLKYEFVLDDKMVITQNTSVLKGIKGIPEILSTDAFYGLSKDGDGFVGGRYRPLSYISFAIEYSLFGLIPWPGHLLNLIFYALTMIILYSIISRLYRINKLSIHPVFSMPFLCVFIYMIHPIHTEIVANIKSRDEIYMFLFALFSLHYAINYLEKRKIISLVYSGLFFVMSSLSKEIGISFFVIIPVTLYFFAGLYKKHILPVLYTLGILTLVMLVWRAVVINPSDVNIYLINDSFLHANIEQKIATKIYILAKYIKLLFYPWPLTWDYYPFHIPYYDFNSREVWISFSVLVTVAAVFVYSWIKKSLVSYSIFFYAATLFLVSNILFSIGPFMAERFLYAPSFAFALFLSWLIIKGLNMVSSNNTLYRTVFIILLVLLLAPYSIIIKTRNKDWKDDITLMIHDSKISKNSLYTNAYSANALMNRASKDKNHSRIFGKQAIENCRKALAINPEYAEVLNIISDAYIKIFNRSDSAIYYYKRLLKVDSTNSLCAYNLGAIYLRLGDEYTNQSIYYLKKSVSLDTSNSSAYNNLGIAYFNIGNYKNAAYYFEKSFNIKGSPSITEKCHNAYTRAGDTAKVRYFEKIISLQGRGK